MRTILLALFVSSVAVAKPLPEEKQLTVIRLMWRASRERAMASFCRMWAEHYRNAYNLDDAEWLKFQKNRASNARHGAGAL